MIDLTKVKSDIIKQVREKLTKKYNCKENEISISFRTDGSLKISIVPDEEFINSLNVKVDVF